MLLNFYFTKHIVLILLLLLVFLLKHSVSLDCVPNSSRLAFTFSNGVPCTVHGTQLYGKTQIIHHLKTVHGTHGHYSSFTNDFATIFLAISFQFSATSGIQTDPYCATSYASCYSLFFQLLLGKICINFCGHINSKLKHCIWIRNI